MYLATLAWVVLAQVPSTPLTGTVVGPGGDPVVGADLVLVGLPAGYDAPIVARGKSGEGGQFSVDRPTSLAGDHHPGRAPILWAWKPGARISATRFPEALPAAGEPVRVVLGPPGGARVLVEGPDGRPMAGAKVLPYELRDPHTIIPDPVAEEMAATTGLDGVAVLDAVTHDELAYADVHADAFGIQGHILLPSGQSPRRMELRPVADARGRLVADDPKLLQGWRVRAYTKLPWRQEGPVRTTGFVETRTDAEGRFALPKIALGNLQLNFQPPRDLPVLPDIPPGLVVVEGSDLSIAVPLKETATVTGVVVERGTGRPVPGASVQLTELKKNNITMLKTDAQGRYSFRCLPGAARLYLNTRRSDHLEPPGTMFEELTVPEGTKVVEIAPKELIRAAPPIRGEVRDLEGHPAPGATVQASWRYSEGGKAGSYGDSDKADEQGTFTIEGIYPNADVSITARHLDRQTKEPVVVPAGERGPLTVTIVPAPVLAVAGRLLGLDGGPLGGVPVRVQFRVERNNQPGFPEAARFEGSERLATAPDGTFRTPKELDREPREYRAEVSAEGYLRAWTPWVPATSDGLLTLPDLTLRRSRGVRAVTGRVVDREGRPVAGATLSQSGDGPDRTSAKADAEGAFRLPGVAGGEALVFAEAPGFRFGGAIVGSGPGPVEVRLARESEPPMADGKPVPSPLSRAEERALGLELLTPVLPMARAGSLGNADDRATPALARLDPERVLDLIEGRAIAPSAALTTVSLAQFESDPASAIATVDLALDPSQRAAGWLALAGYRPRPDRARLEDLLDRALADARKVPGAEARVGLLGSIADRWLDLGSLERARPILLEGQALLKDRTAGSFWFEAEAFGEALAVIDLPAAIDLFERKGVKNTSPQDAASLRRHRGQAALRLARFDPEAAERLVDPPGPNFYDRTSLVVEVARRMAPADLPRARRLLETLAQGKGQGHDPFFNPATFPTGLGRLAGAVVEVDPVAARKLLDEAFAGLRSVVLGGWTGNASWSVSNAIAGLLPTSERVEPARVAERAWLAAACRPPSNRDPQAQEVAATLDLAVLVARYDRGLARVIAAEEVDRLPDMVLGSHWFNYYQQATIRGLAAYDPRAIAPLLRALPDSARRPPRNAQSWNAASVENLIRLDAAEILGLPVEARPRALGVGGNSWRFEQAED